MLADLEEEHTGGIYRALGRAGRCHLWGLPEVTVGLRPWARQDFLPCRDRLHALLVPTLLTAAMCKSTAMATELLLT